MLVVWLYPDSAKMGKQTDQQPHGNRAKNIHGQCTPRIVRPKPVPHQAADGKTPGGTKGTASGNNGNLAQGNTHLDMSILYRSLCPYRLNAVDASGSSNSAVC